MVINYLLSKLSAVRLWLDPSSYERQTKKQKTSLSVVSTALLKPGKADWRPATPHTPEWFVLVTLRASGEWHLHGGSVENGETKMKRDCCVRGVMQYFMHTM